MTTSFYPEGYAGSTEPHCGVLAVAICAKVSFEDAWDAIKRIGGYGSTWKGRTYHDDRVKALDALGVSFVKTRHLRSGSYLAENDAPRCTVQTFAKWAKPGTYYMLRIGGHVLTLIDGIVIDQYGASPATSHRRRRGIVSHSIEIIKH